MPSHKHKKKKKHHKHKEDSVSSDGSSSFKAKRSSPDSDDSNNEEKSLVISRKNKKRKKLHKHARKQSSLNSDDDVSLFKVKFSDSDSDDPENEERLTSLVRRLYINHLHEALSQNFEGWINSADEQSKDILQELVNKWSSVLEQKALRACMISELYRRNMVSSIRNIKTSTNNGRLHINEKGLSKLKFKLPSSKETQTDVLTDNTDHPTMCVAETQTDSQISSLLLLPLPKTITFSPSSRPYDPAIDFSDSHSGSPDVSSSLGSKQLESSANQDLCNITSTSDLFDPTTTLFDHRATDITSAQDSSTILPIKLSDQSCEHSLTDKNNTTINILTNCKDIKRITQTHDKTDNFSHNEQENVHKKEKQTFFEQAFNDNSAKDDLDARLNAMGLLTDFGNEMENVPKSKKSNWYAEEIAQSCNLTKVLLGMSTKQRERVLKKIKELFGDDDEPLTELTEKNIAICRKRIATVVVMELTPIYQAKRIASRHLFKFLAKKITKSLMEQSFAPDTRSIRWKVQEFFSDGNIIMSESDCN